MKIYGSAQNYLKLSQFYGEAKTLYSEMFGLKNMAGSLHVGSA